MLWAPPTPPEVSAADIEEARAEDARAEEGRQRRQKEKESEPTWGERPIDFPGWIQVSPGIGAVSLFAVERGRFGWSGKIAGGRFLAFGTTMLGFGASFRVGVPKDSVAQAQVRPALDILMGANFGRSYGYVGMSHGVVAEFYSDDGRPGEDGPVLGSYSPGFKAGLLVLAWRGLFVGLELDVFVHEIRDVDTNGFPVAPEFVYQKSAASLAFDLSLGWRFPGVDLS